MGGAVAIGALALAFMLLGGKKAKAATVPAPPAPGRRPAVPPTVLDAAMRACIEQAAPVIAERILWTNDDEKHGWVVQLTAGRFVKAAQCVTLEGEDLAACIGMLPDAVAADLRAMATPLSGAAQFGDLAQHLEDNGFGEAAGCFRP